MITRKDIYCLLDTETYGGASHPKGMYNLGGYIFDRYQNTYASFNLLIMENYDEIEKDDYAKKNFHLYEERLRTGEITAICTEDEAVQMVDNLCNMYGVKYMMAYNTAFDFTKTKCAKLIENRQFIDIYLMALQTITHKKSYAEFCRKNNFKSASGKSCATSAESVYVPAGSLNGNDTFFQFVNDSFALPIKFLFVTKNDCAVSNVRFTTEPISAVISRGKSVP